jgi:hypothetical protein
MAPLSENQSDQLRAALLIARENERRRKELCPEDSADGERMAQWTTIAKLRRAEVERIEVALEEIGAPIPSEARFEA